MTNVASYITMAQLFISRFRDRMQRAAVTGLGPVLITAAAVLISLVGMQACQGTIDAPRRPMVKDGHLDARSVDLVRGETLHLQGTWKFIWLRDNPAFADPRFDDSAWTTIAVPGYWNGITGTGQGYGWYRCRITVDGEKLRASKVRLALSVRLIRSSYELYVNGVRLMGSGTVGADERSAVPQLIPRLESFEPPPTGDEIVIAVRNANYAHRSGGPYTIPEMGINAVLAQKRWYTDVIHLVAMGILLMMCIYHAMLWVGRREDRSSLYFFLGCLVILLRLIATSDILERLFPFAHLHELHFTIVYGSIPLGWMTFALFFRELFKEEFSGRIFTAAMALGGLYTASILLLPCRIYSTYAMVYEVSLLVFGSWFLAGIIIAAGRKRRGALTILPGFVVFFFTGVHDILAAKLIVTTPEMTPVGLVIMIFFQSAVISSRFSRAFRTAEHLSQNLAIEVANKTELLREQMNTAVEAKSEAERSRAEVREAYEQLNSVYTIIKNDLDVARNIQETLFPTDRGERGGLRYYAHYIPLIEVGGDVYDLHALDEHTVRLFIADARGHGIHASLITMLIKGEYDILKYSLKRPLDIVTELNDKFYQEYRSIAQFFTAFLADIDTARKTVTYVSAGHPSQYIIRNDAIEELRTTGRAMGYSATTGCTQQEAGFNAGDRLLAFTDGLYEQFDSDRTLFGEERIRRIIRERAGFPITDIMSDLIAAIDRHTSKDLCDDITLIGIE